MSNEEQFKFVWKYDDQSFLNWMLISLISGLPKEDHARINGRSKVPNEFTLAIQVNGVEVPVEHFVQGVESNMDHMAKQEARRMLSEVGFEELEEYIGKAQRMAMSSLRLRLRRVGINLEDEED